MSLLLPTLNAGLLLFLIWFVWQRLPYAADKKVWLGYAALKSLAACTFVWVYSHHYGTGDMLNYIRDAEIYRTLSLPAFIGGVVGAGAPDIIIDQLVYDFDPRAILMAKMVALAHFLPGNMWITALNFAMFGGVVIFRFYIVIKRAFPTLAIPAIGAFLLFPSLVFWTSGICKEAVSFPAMLLVLTPLLRLKVDGETTSWVDWTLAALGAMILWLLKYYVAAIVLPACLLFGLSTFFDWFPYRKLALGVVAYIGLLLLISQLHPNLYLHRTMQVMVDNYELTIRQTQPEKTAHYEGLTPDVLSFGSHFPEAVFTGLFMPLLGQQWDLPSLAVVVQNSLLLLTLIITVIGMTLKKSWKSIPAGVWALVGLIILLSGLIAITTPNFGTLDRYRVAYQPFMVLLVIAGIQQLTRTRKIP
ncbi:MAG: hypothetical protein RIF33_14455 [Cyclobacteriaceae bacterium]